ncbi:MULTISPECIES: hypothetical protein [Comamonas]|uniref:hypothetical protein n=1 Tax=Comamonas TaxID=283 RepID=UPI0005F7E9E0|nr:MULTISPECIES: hypothetical protein [Comamonas]MBL5979055.1 hypothetical protein [Comamonas sp. NyZ500]CUA97850.1 hypothetical protein Ga0061062_106194 [Comamonas thiooxydans]
MKLRILSFVFGVLGFALLVGGLALWSIPVALCVAGVGLLLYALLLDKAAAALIAKGDAQK